jgi:hypothetical protein
MRLPSARPVREQRTLTGNKLSPAFKARHATPFFIKIKPAAQDRQVAPATRDCEFPTKRISVRSEPRRKTRALLRRPIAHPDTFVNWGGSDQREKRAVYCAVALSKRDDRRNYSLITCHHSFPLASAAAAPYSRARRQRLRPRPNFAPILSARFCRSYQPRCDDN